MCLLPGGGAISGRQATAEQLALCLPSALIRADSTDGSLRLSVLPASAACDHAGAHPCDGSRLYRSNRYWSAELLEQRGCIVTVRFDPDHPASVRVYGAEDGFLCTAERLRPAGFDDTQAAGEHARARKTFMQTSMVEAKKHAGG